MRVSIFNCLVLSGSFVANSVLGQVNNPPRNLYADPLSLIATWEAPDTALVPEQGRELIDYHVFLNNSQVGITTETSFQFDPETLNYGTAYLAGVAAHYSTGFSDTVTDAFTSVYLVPVSDLTADCEDGDVILTWTNPDPDSLSLYILGYNIYRDGDFVNFIPYNPPIQVYGYENTGPGNYCYTVTVVYDLTGFGFPGETGESMEAGPACASCVYGFILPFLEDWNSGTFDTNNWSADAVNWEVTGQQGQDPPGASFTSNPQAMNYYFSLESFPFNLLDMSEGEIYVDFDLKLDASDASGTENMRLQAWNWENQLFETVREFGNDTGSFDWQKFHVDITPFALNQIIKIRFLATGSSTAHIQAWFIDNIEIYRSCFPPVNVEASGNPGEGYVDVTWDPPFGFFDDQWIYWDDGINYSSIGSGAGIEFDVAARWEPSQLSSFYGAVLTEVAFVPGEETAMYNIRIWTGEGPGNLVVSQPVYNFTIGSYNTVTLYNPLPIDITQELWVGYAVYTTTGYPAGCDDGPAIDGYGNMINLGGWQTLLQIDPELDYNWNIKAYLENSCKKMVLMHDQTGNKNREYSSGGFRDFSHYEIFRSVEFGPYEYLDNTNEESYQDFDVQLFIQSYCYKVRAIYSGESDTCISELSGESCTPVVPGELEKRKNTDLQVYPNPANAFLVIHSNQEINTVRLFDALGKEIYSEKSDKERNIDVRNFPNGIYLLKIGLESRQVFRKIVILH
jgi:hypothetical protein